MRSGIWRFAVAPSNAASKNCNIGAQLHSLRCIITPKLFWKIYFLYDFWCAQTCSFRAVFGLPVWSLTNWCQRYVTLCRKNLYRCTCTFSALNYCSGICFKSPSYLYEVVRTNFSAEFWTFERKWELCSASQRTIHSEKAPKSTSKLPINSHTILVWTMSPTRRQTECVIQKHSYKPARVVRSYPALCKLRENVVKMKVSIIFSIQCIVFPAVAKMLIFVHWRTELMPWQPAGN